MIAHDKTKISVYDIIRKKLILNYSHSNTIESILITNNGRYVASICLDTVLTIHDLQNEAPMQQSCGVSRAKFDEASAKVNKKCIMQKQLCSSPHDIRLRHLTENGKYIVTKEDIRTAKIYNTETKILVLEKDIGFTFMPKVAISENGMFLAYSKMPNYPDSQVHVYNIKKDELKTYDHTCFVTFLQFSPCSTLLLSSSSKNFNIYSTNENKVLHRAQMNIDIQGISPHYKKAISYSHCSKKITKYKIPLLLTMAYQKYIDNKIYKKNNEIFWQKLHNKVKNKKLYDLIIRH